MTTIKMRLKPIQEYCRERDMISRNYPFNGQTRKCLTCGATDDFACHIDPCQRCRGDYELKCETCKSIFIAEYKIPKTYNFICKQCKINKLFS